MKILRTPEDLQKWRDTVQGSVGFVPTMGALHLGHAELLKKSRAENQISVLSIFVNPTQFNDPKDFAKYPITWDADLKVAKEQRVDVVFAPTRDMMYPDGYKYKVTENELSLILCGNSRPGHFDGVLSVVMKLLNLVRPARAYFGEKDFQQLELIRGMVRAFFMNLEIVPVPTLREKSGLALSSRNHRLTVTERENLAPLIHRRLKESATAVEAQNRLRDDGFKIDYVTDIANRRLAAVFLGEVRLIDNVEI